MALMPGGFEMLKDSPILQVALTDAPGGPDSPGAGGHQRY